MPEIRAIFGNFTKERLEIDDAASDGIFCGIGIVLGEKVILGMTFDEAEKLANELRSYADAFKNLRAFAGQTK